MPFFLFIIRLFLRFFLLLDIFKEIIWPLVGQQSHEIVELHLNLFFYLLHFGSILSHLAHHFPLFLVLCPLILYDEPFSQVFAISLLVRLHYFLNFCKNSCLLLFLEDFELSHDSSVLRVTPFVKGAKQIVRNQVVHLLQVIEKFFHFALSQTAHFDLFSLHLFLVLRIVLGQLR